jgi:hypothetical protein
MQGFFNAENAKAYSLKGQETRRQNKLRRESAANALLNPEATLQAFLEIESGGFNKQMLNQARDKIKAVWVKIEDAIDAGESKVLKEYTDALKCLAEIERQLAGRPLPGSLRPKSEKSKRIPSAQAEPDEV